MKTTASRKLLLDVFASKLRYYGMVDLLIADPSKQPTVSSENERNLGNSFS